MDKKTFVKYCSRAYAMGLNNMFQREFNENLNKWVEEEKW